MLLRPAKIDDVPAVLPMVEAICAMHEALDPDKYGFVPNPAERYRQWLIERARDPRSVFLVADREEAGPDGEARLAGFLVATTEREIPIYRLGEYGFIHDLWVEEAYRHEGLGRHLVMLAVERFEQLGLRQIRLDTAAANPAARALFTACGFRLSTMQMLCELGSEDRRQKRKGE